MTEDSCKVLLGDCLEVMKSMPDNSIDLILADPPYPEMRGGGIKHLPRQGRGTTQNESEVVGDPWNADLSWIQEAWRIAKYGMMVFCSFHSVDTVRIPLREYSIALISWYKRNSPVSVNNVPRYETEFIWVFKKAPGLKWRNLRTHYDVPGVPGGSVGRERIKTASGTTCEACIDFGIPFIAIDNDPIYFEVTEKRIKKATHQGRLF